MQATSTRPKIIVSADGDGVVSHVGSRLLADPGRIPVDVASALADGATTICEIAVLADQEAVFGAVASDSTVWRLLDRLDGRHLAAVAAARARASTLLSVVLGAAAGSG